MLCCVKQSSQGNYINFTLLNVNENGRFTVFDLGRGGLIQYCTDHMNIIQPGRYVMDEVLMNFTLPEARCQGMEPANTV